MTDKRVHIDRYIRELEDALSGCDPALVMDAVNDANEYLYSEVDTLLSKQPELSEASAVTSAVKRFGSPQEVALAFKDMESHTLKAFTMRKPREQRGWFRKFWGIILDPRAYGSMFYVILSVFTGLLYGIWIIYGFLISLIASIFIIGIPVCMLFFGSLRVFGYLESRLVESMLGVRMPRRPIFRRIKGNILTKFTVTVSDLQTWKTFIYLLLMMPLGMIYFTGAAFIVGTVVEFLVLPFFPQFPDVANVPFKWVGLEPGLWSIVIAFPAGFILFTIWLHLVRFVGKLHARWARLMLVSRHRVEPVVNEERPA